MSSEGSRRKGQASSLLVNLMMSLWVTSNMIHDLHRKFSFHLISGGLVTVSMETDMTREAFKLIDFEFNTRQKELFALIHICGFGNIS